MKTEQIFADSTIRLTTWDIVLKQYKFRLRTHVEWFGWLLILTVISTLLLIFQPVRMYPSEYFSISFHEGLRQNTVIYIFFVAMFFFGIQLTVGKHRQMMLLFIKNNRSSSLANFLFLFTLSVFAGVLSYLTIYAVRFVMYFIQPPVAVLELDILSVLDLGIGVVTTILYMLFIASIGYLAGEVFQGAILFVSIIFMLVFVPFYGANFLVGVVMYNQYGGSALQSIGTMVLLIMLISLTVYVVSRMGRVED